MDKKNTFIGVILLLAAFYFMYDGSKREAAQKQAQAAAAIAEPANQARREAIEKQSMPAQIARTTSPFAPEENFKEDFVTLKNDFILARFTNKGGAIKNVELLKYEKQQNSAQPYIFNEVEGATTAMGLAIYDPKTEFPAPIDNKFALVESSSKRIVYEYIASGVVKITRTYILMDEVKADYSPYAIATKTVIENISQKPLSLKEIYVCLGAVPPTVGDVYGTNLAFGLYDGDKIHFAKSTSFIDSEGMFGIGSSKAKPFEKLELKNILWGSLKNQFFTSVFTPEKIVGAGGIAAPIAIDLRSENKYMRSGVTGYMAFQADTLQPKQTWEISGAFYAGPKELDRLFSMGNGQEAVMDYGWFGFISRPLSRLMNWIHSGVATIAPEWAWGWAIIILTVIVRLALWPLTSIQIRSAKRMAKLQEPMKEIRLKYKNEPQKANQEIMKLYGEYGINPLAGCLPMLVQLPIFIGLYYMLQTSCEIRFAHFLWIDDLAMPDTIAAIPTVFGIPFHLLPIINAVVTFLQMHLSPMPSTDKTQAMLFKLMPVIMLLFFYNFASGLVLYWTVQSLLGIVQTLMIRFGKDNVKLKKRTKPSFMQRLQDAASKAQEMQKVRGPEFDKLSIAEKMKLIKEENAKIRQKVKEDRLKGTMYEQRKKNPGGRSTPPKRK